MKMINDHRHYDACCIHEGSLVEAAEVLDRAPGCIVGPGPTAYVLHLNPTPICPFACHGDDNDDDDNDDDDDDDNGDDNADDDNDDNGDDSK